MKIPSLHQSLVLLLSISPLERDLIKLPNYPLPPEISAIHWGWGLWHQPCLGQSYASPHHLCQTWQRILYGVSSDSGHPRLGNWVEPCALKKAWSLCSSVKFPVRGRRRMENLTRTLKFLSEEGFFFSFQCHATEFSQSNWIPICLQNRTLLCFCSHPPNLREL